MKIICQDCKHHRTSGPIWYDNYCHHPSLKVIRQDPVSGEKTIEYPHVREQNGNLDCELRADQ